MNLDALGLLSALGWRGVVLLLAGLFALYVLVAFIRLRRIGRPKPAPATPPPLESPATVEDPFILAPPMVAREVPLDSYEANQPWASAPNFASTNGPNSVPNNAANNDDLARRLTIAEQEVVSLRAQVAALNDTVTELAEELRAEISRSATQAKTVTHLSPLYGDAMQMALAGNDVKTISERCGIARAEAELVVALAQQQADERGSDGGQAGY